MKRQALYACNTCTPKGGEAAGVCLACSYKCHEGHDLFELYTKRYVYATLLVCWCRRYNSICNECVNVTNGLGTSQKLPL